ncbi:hypothetical protein [Mycobacteroides chelonae]|uniref:hypothetical protein n=1 Tax=Mycobacteroides chelonae TaxID=1774 RepID=UPI001C2BA59F|nr:hypothetical protein [Mycobacteroides chelonae]MBV0917077.1 hypothetical protein [Mycobacteroides chelonae]
MTTPQPAAASVAVPVPAVAADAEKRGSWSDWKWFFVSLPFLFACVRLVIAAGGDPETLKALVLSLDVKALVLGTLLPFGSTILLWIYVLLIASSVNGRVKNGKKVGPAVASAVLFAPLMVVTLMYGMPVRYLLINASIILIFIIASVGSHLKNRFFKFISQALGIVWIVGTAIALVYIFFALGMWLPKERIVTDEAVIPIGYILSSGEVWTTYLDDNHVVRVIETSNIKSRALVDSKARWYQKSLAECWSETR